jgi:hypothetical protein
MAMAMRHIGHHTYSFASRWICNDIWKYFRAWIRDLSGIVWWKNQRCRKFRDTVFLRRKNVSSAQKCILAFCFHCCGSGSSRSWSNLYSIPTTLEPNPQLLWFNQFLKWRIYTGTVPSAVTPVPSMPRIGGVLCPYVNMLSDFWTPLPLIIYGTLATAGGLLALLLPETLGRMQL